MEYFTHTLGIYEPVLASMTCHTAQVRREQGKNKNKKKKNECVNYLWTHNSLKNFQVLGLPKSKVFYVYAAPPRRRHYYTEYKSNGKVCPLICMVDGTNTGFPWYLRLRQFSWHQTPHLPFKKLVCS